MAHNYGPRREKCRVSLVVAGNGTSPTASFLALALQDFGSEVTLLSQPTQQQLQRALHSLPAASSNPTQAPWAEEASLYFAGSGCQWQHRWQVLQLLEVAADSSGTSSSSSRATVLVAPFEELEQQCRAAQLPLLIHVDSVPSSSHAQPWQQQAEAFAGALRDRCCFSHRVTAMDCEDEEAAAAWGWALFKHTFLVWHPSWAEAHAAAAAELRAAGIWEPQPVFASDESNTQLFLHGYVPEQHHRVLKLLHDITAAAAAAPKSARTANLLQQLLLLLADTSGWRQFVLRWGLLQLTATNQADITPAAAVAAAATERAASSVSGRQFAGPELDQAMAEHKALFAAEMRLPGALLVLAAEGGPAVQAAALGVMQQLPPLSDYGAMPGEVPGKPDTAARQQLGRSLAEGQVAVSVGDLSGLLQLWQVTFVAGFLAASGMTDLLAELAEAEGEGDEEQLQLAAASTAAAFAGFSPAAAPAPAASPAAPTAVAPPAAKRRRTGNSSAALLLQQSPGSSADMDVDPAALAAVAAGLMSQSPRQCVPGDGAGSSAAAAASSPAAAAAHSGQQQQAEEQQERYYSWNVVIGPNMPQQLPPGAHVVAVDDMLSAEPLHQLRRLHTLQLHGCTAPPNVLLQLTALTGLREIHLSFRKPTGAVAGCSAWSSLRLKDLSFSGRAKAKWGKKATLTVMEQLTRLTGLTSLTFACRMPFLEPADLASHLSSLTSLARLSFNMLSLKGDSFGENYVRSMLGLSIWHPVLRAIASLPRLESLVFFLMLGVSGAVSELAACSSGRLTQASLSSCGVDDAAGAALSSSSSLRTLRLLDLSAFGEQKIGDATMAAIARNLTNLTSLCVMETSVSAAAVSQVEAAIPGIKVVT